MVTLALLVSGARGQELSEADCAAARQSVLPNAAEQAWLSIPWQDNLAEALLEAEAKDRPVLLWAMNGHPLGCT